VWLVASKPLKAREPSSATTAPAPWATIIAVVAAVAVFFIPAASSALVYDRERILAGEWWRLLTGEWVHFSGSRLWWNVAVLLPAGIWAERVQPWRARVLYLIGPLLIGGALFTLEPLLIRHGGLSGLAAAFVAFLALAQLQQPESDRWFWRTVLALLALKIIAEVIVASRLLSHYAEPGVRSVALSHLAGIVAGVIALGARRRRKAR
jgi:rhomboid family GlyGly-CTERM serine protease